MEPLILRNGCRRAIAVGRNLATKRRAFHSSRRQQLATPVESQGEVRAAKPIRFTSNQNQFARNRPRAQFVEEDGSGRRRGPPTDRGDGSIPLLQRIRIVPASPSYFTATPRYTDDLLYLSRLLRKYQTLPLIEKTEAPRVAWKTITQYKAEVAEPVRAKSFKALLELLKRLNYIHPSLIPEEVTQAMEKFKRLVQPHHNQPKPILIDKFGRATAMGRRKSSGAAVTVVEGDGQVLINGKSLTNYFGRLHDRETAVWALKASARLDKYNVFAIAKGGGTTGQADAIALGLAKALLAHEPDLKAALRRAGVVTRDPRRVERKKPGKLKARKMPAWVKR